MSAPMTIRIKATRSECGRMFATTPDLIGLYAIGKDSASLERALPEAIRSHRELAGPKPGLVIERAADQEGYESCWTVTGG